MVQQVFANLLAETASLQIRLVELRAAMAAAAQEVYDAWEQDEAGLDPELGSGGICDLITKEIGDVLAQAGIDCQDGGQEGDDHAFLVAYDDRQAFVVDIPCGEYEVGGGYQWTKRPGVVFEAEMVTINEMSRSWIRTED